MHKQNNSDKKLNENQRISELKTEAKTDRLVVSDAKTSIDSNQLVINSNVSANLNPRASAPALDEGLTIYDLNPKFFGRINLVAVATSLLVVVGSANQQLENHLGEKLLNSIMPAFVLFATAEVLVVFSVFFFFCGLAFCTIGISFEKDRATYTRWVKLFGITMFRQKRNVSSSSKIYINSTHKFGIQFFVISIGQNAPVLIHRFVYKDCLELQQRIAQFLLLTVEDDS